MEFLLILIIVLLIGTGVIFVVRRLSRRGQELKQLCENGSAAVGTLTEVRAERRSRSEDDHFIRYTFKSFTGNEYSRELKVKESEYVNYTQGQAVDIIYLPNDPDINALKILVDQMREALQQSK